MKSFPRSVGAYEVRGEVGSGGMGVVYVGWDPRLNRQVAIKTLRRELAQDEQARAMFLREARAVAAVSHPNVTQVYDFGEQDGFVYFVMEFLDGRSLRTILREDGTASPRRAISLIRMAAQGLKAAAERNIIHRDVKPSNLVLTHQGELKVTDFGLAKPLTEPGGTGSTALIGTADYMSPERATGKPADFRSDIYALGATFYELVTGRTPFVGDTPVTVVMQHVKERVPEPKRFKPDLPYPVTALILKMLAKRPEARPQSYDELIHELDRLAEVLAQMVGPVAAVPTVTEAAPLRSAARSWALPLALSLLVVMTAMGVAGKLRRSEAAPGGAQALVGTGGGPATAARPLIEAGAFEAAGERADLTIVRHDREFDADGRLRVYGDVSNVGSARAAGAEIKVTLVDEEGQEVGIADIPLTPTLLGPGESGVFDVTFPPGVTGERIKMELSWLS
jgi:predicted Ser/Thr protein kinase